MGTPKIIPKRIRRDRLRGERWMKRGVEGGREVGREGDLIGSVDAMMCVQSDTPAREKLFSSMRPYCLEEEEEVGWTQVMILWIKSVRKHLSSPSKPLKAIKQSGFWSGGGAATGAGFFVSFFGVFFLPFVGVFSSSSSPSLSSLAIGPKGDLVDFVAFGLVGGGGETTVFAPLCPPFEGCLVSGGDLAFIDFPEGRLELLRLGESGSGRASAASGVGSDSGGLDLAPSGGVITFSEVIKKSFSGAFRPASRHCSTQRGETMVMSINSAARRCFKFPFAQIM
jgi:hypothetical protein